VADDATTRFFDELSTRGNEPLLRKARGRVRFDIVDGKHVERRFVDIDKGSITVSRRNVACDNVMRVDKGLFERIATGRANPVAAVLRGELVAQGDWKLLVLIQRLFPGPATKQTSRGAAGYAKRR
jgi:putative sterol carrier protein